MTQAKVIVANGAGVKGLAGNATTSLQAAFPTATFLPATDANAKYQASAVYYTEGFEAQAGEVATSIGLHAERAVPARAAAGRSDEDRRRQHPRPPRCRQGRRGDGPRRPSLP